MGPEPTEPDEILDIVEEEAREQGAIDEWDEAPAAKVARRDALRSALDSELEIEPDRGPNPS
jgi:hypothetical protein